MTRLLTTILLAALLILGVWSFIGYEQFLLGPSPDMYSWWWPDEVSTYGEDIDGLFNLIAVMVLFFFVLTTGVLIWCVWRFSKRREDKAWFTHGSHRLEMIWTAIPAGLLIIIAFSQMSTWAAIKFKGAMEGEPIFAEITASQFDWRYRYPGPDGQFGTGDDVETPFELVVPDDQKLVFNLRSRDVLHSFFVPMLRLKQDAVPGMTIPIWFEIDREELAEHPEDAAGNGHSFDVICAELCGWGHYKMSGRVRVLPRAEFDVWMAEQVAAKFTNGVVDDE